MLYFYDIPTNLPYHNYKKNKNGRLFHNIPPLCDFVDCHTFTSLICLTQPLTYNLYHYYLKAF